MPPPAGGDKILINDYSLVAAASVAKPLVRLIQTVTQSFASGAIQAVTFTSETIDTDGFFNAGTSTTRVVPNKSGYYRVRGVLYWPAATVFLSNNAWIRKNGASNLPPAGRLGGQAGVGGGVGQIFATETEAILDMNGTTDYIELIGQHATTGAVSQSTNVSTQFSSVLEMEYLRGL